MEESQTNLNEQELREFILNKNTKKFHLPTCSSVDSMAEKNKEIYEGTVDELNGDKMNGAGLILRGELMQQFGKIVGGDFYILPSSCHEVFVIPESMGMDVKEL
mgnify:CR=1 FL=1